MPKLIFRSNYMRDAPPEHLANYVKYIATREGVEKIPQSKSQLPATVKQQNLITSILRDISNAKDMLEYEDYLLHPTRENASEFITQALENNIDLIEKRKNYVDYIATRPRVERIGEHGLFTDAGTTIILAQVAEEAAKHKGIIWTHVISLRREDAVRLGYDNAAQWEELLRSKKAMLCKNMKISAENFQWYAAFHNESHHTHVHLMVYSRDEREGYLTRHGIEAMRFELAHSIFRQDFMSIYERQNQSRQSLKNTAESVMRELIQKVQSDICENKAIEEKIIYLSERLKKTSGKKVYGYLKPDLKILIDQIVDELAKDEKVSQFYVLWNEAQNDILKTYTGHFPNLPPLSAQKQFKSIKNMVIAEALKIGSHHFTFEEDEIELTSAVLEGGIGSTLPTAEVPISGEDFPSAINEIPPDEQKSLKCSSTRNGSEGSRCQVVWSERYKEARKRLYGYEEIEPDFESAYRLFLEEAETGNALAMQDLGRIYKDGLGVEINEAEAQEWCHKALRTFKTVEKEKPKPYIEYRIGKIYAAGLGTAQSYSEAANWFDMAVSQNHKFAQYSLAELYYQGQGVNQNYKTAFYLFAQSASQGNPYASYELAKMFRDGLGTKKSAEKADEHFQQAFTGFSLLERKNRDDKLQYRLGHMLYTGTGTDRNVPAAIRCFEKAAKLDNVHAQYMLGKIYLNTDDGTENIAKALLWLNKAAKSGNDLAQYALGKLYRDGCHVKRDFSKAVELFTHSAEHKNQYAAYALGKLFLSGDIVKDISSAVKWLELSARLGNSFAQYSLAKLYFAGEDIPKDIPRAVNLMKESARQNNQYAQYQLGKLYLWGVDIAKDVGASIKWLTTSAEQGNQYAQYALGKLYLTGRDVLKDREAALKWLTKSSEQGNIYAQFLIDHIDSSHEPSVLLIATRLMHHLANIFGEEPSWYRSGQSAQIDRKLLRKMHQKKMAQGHAHDDYAPKQIY